MNYNDVVSKARSQVGYHEKQANTPEPALYIFRNSYDGSQNWTKFHNDLGIAQGQDWCGFFAYWVFWKLLNEDFSATTSFLHNISSLGSAVSYWVNAFTSAGKFHPRNSGYTPKVGDVVAYSDVGVPYSHVEIIVSTASMPTYLTCVGGNTRYTSGSGESTGMWVAERTRSAVATSGFHVLGYCEVDYDGGSVTGEFPPEWGGFLLNKRRRGWIF